MNDSDFSALQRPPALIVTYNPPAGFEDHLEKLFAEFQQIVLVDNGSSPEFQQVLKMQASRWGTALVLLINPQNLGVAAALNQGFDWAIRHGYEYIVGLDQDSLPVPGMVEEIQSVYKTFTRQDEIAIVAPMVTDPGAGIIARYLRPKYHLFFERKGCTDRILEDISIVITSGSMYNLKTYERVGPFRNDFFIDYVDTEYCLRIKKQGFDIIVACNARLQHRLGNQQRFRVGPLEIRPTFHSIIRWYYISRNRIPMIREYGIRFPHWLLYELVINSYGFLRMLCFEDHKLGKILAVILGGLDGLAGRSGEIPDYRKDFLSRFE